MVQRKRKREEKIIGSISLFMNVTIPDTHGIVKESESIEKRKERERRKLHRLWNRGIQKKSKSKYRQTSLFAIFLSANSRICDLEM
jgi:hypothetical protein